MARILVCDDDPSVRRLLEVTLSFDHEVLVVEDGQQVLDLLARDAAIDLVVLDVMMPGRDGLATLRELRATPAGADVPVVLLTARAQQEDAEAGLAAGADHYVTKPFDPLELEQLIEGSTA